MTKKSYVPKTGSHPRRAIEILEGYGERWIASTQLAELLCVSPFAVRSLLEVAVRHEYIELKHEAHRNFYRLGPRRMGAQDAASAHSIDEAPRAGRRPPSVFDMRDENIPMPTGAQFGVWADGRINISRAGEITEQLSPAEARALALVLRERAMEEEGA